MKREVYRENGKRRSRKTGKWRERVTKKEAERGRRREMARLEGGEVGIKRKRKGDSNAGSLLVASPSTKIKGIRTRFPAFSVIGTARRWYQGTRDV